MHRRNMRAFARYLEQRVKPEQLNSAYYRNEDGTKGCLAGWAYVHQRITEGLHVDFSAPLAGVSKADIRITARGWLGLTPDQALLLFNSPRKVSPREAAVAIRQFATHRATPFLWAHLPFVGWWDGLPRKDKHHDRNR